MSLWGWGRGHSRARRPAAVEPASEDEAQLRQAVEHARVAPNNLELLEDCAALAQAQGRADAARLLRLTAVLLDGASPADRARQADIVRTFDLGAMTDEARDLLELMGAMEALPAEAEKRAAEPPPGRRCADTATLARLADLVAELCSALEADEGARRADGALKPLRDAVAGCLPFSLDEGGIGAGDLAMRLAFNRVHGFLVAHSAQAFAPFGSGALLHRLARCEDVGLGAYGRRLSDQVVGGREALGLFQLAFGRPLDAAGDQDLLRRVTALVAAGAPPSLQGDLVEDLADLGHSFLAWRLLGALLHRPEIFPDRHLLQRIRDAGMDLEDLDLAWRAQRLLADHWGEDRNEWLALGDLTAYRGDYAEAQTCFAQALRLDPENGHARDCLEALRRGDHARFRNPGGFGSSEARRRLRAERRNACGRTDFSTAAQALQRAGAEQGLAPELAPADPPATPPAPHLGLHLRRLGSRRARSRWGELPVLAGVEAIRCIYVSVTPMTQFRILFDGRLLAAGAPQSHVLEPGGLTKHVVNAWVDLSAVAPGRHEVELTFVDAERRSHVHREPVLVERPATAGEFPGSDAWVEPPSAGAGPLEAALNARPSMVRPARRRPFPAPKEVLVVRTDQLGDMVCSLPALRRLREILPEARLTGLLSPAAAPLARTFGIFDEIMVVDFAVHPVERRRTLSLERQAELRAELHARRFDIAIDLADNAPSRPLLLLSGARRLYGVQDGRYGFLDYEFQARTRDPVNGSEEVPATNKMLAMVEWLGVAMRSLGVTSPRPPEPERLQRLGLEAGRYALLHTGARLKFSRWPHFDALAAGLLAQTGLDVVMLDEAPPAELPPALAGSPRFRSLAGELPFEDLDALVSECAVFVGNDSGPKHLASLRGAPVVSLHCARNNWNEWGQENTGVVISRRVPCAGCQISDHPEECGKDIACMSFISPGEVLQAALGLIGRRQ